VYVARVFRRRSGLGKKGWEEVLVFLNFSFLPGWGYDFFPLYIYEYWILML